MGYLKDRMERFRAAQQSGKTMAELDQEQNERDAWFNQYPRVVELRPQNLEVQEDVAETELDTEIINVELESFKFYVFQEIPPLWEIQLGVFKVLQEHNSKGVIELAYGNERVKELVKNIPHFNAVITKKAEELLALMRERYIHIDTSAESIGRMHHELDAWYCNELRTVRDLSALHNMAGV